jgi:hypothetical protein
MSNSEGDKEKKTALGRLSLALEQIVKIAAALTGLAYLFGLVVLSVHLGRYGHNSLGLLEIDYVVVGIWSLSPIALAALLAFLFGYFYLEPSLFQESGDGKRPARRDVFTAFVVPLIVWIVFVSLFFNLLDVTFRWAWVGAMALGLFVGAGIGILPLAIAGAKEMKERLLLGAGLIWAIVVLPLYLFFFGRSLYGTIPDVWGGGKLAEVVLVAKDENSRKLIESVGVPFADARKSRPVKLILETKEEIVVLPARRTRGVKLDSDLVVAVLYGR